jgi:hypothetical protein
MTDRTVNEPHRSRPLALASMAATGALAGGLLGARPTPSTDRRDSGIGCAPIQLAVPNYDDVSFASSLDAMRARTHATLGTAIASLLPWDGRRL